MRAFVNIDPEAIGNWAEKRNMPYSGYTDLASRDEVYDLVRECVERVNADLAGEPEIANSQIPLPHPAQGAGGRRRRAHATQGAPWLHREKYSPLLHVSMTV